MSDEPVDESEAVEALDAVLPDGRTAEYVTTPAIDRDEVERALLAGDEEAAGNALVRAALNDPDRTWLEGLCKHVCDTGSEDMRLIAALGLSHVSRRFGRLSAESTERVRRLAESEGPPFDMYLDDIVFNCRQQHRWFRFWSRD